MPPQEVLRWMLPKSGNKLFFLNWLPIFALSHAFFLHLSHTRIWCEENPANDKLTATKKTCSAPKAAWLIEQ